jgi:hypothetical protein
MHNVGSLTNLEEGWIEEITLEEDTNASNTNSSKKCSARDSSGSEDPNWECTSEYYESINVHKRQKQE